MSTLPVKWKDETQDDVWAVPDYEDTSTPDVHASRVTRDENVWSGMATVAGSRVPVFMIADLEAEGEAVGAICSSSIPGFECRIVPASFAGLIFAVTGGSLLLHRRVTRAGDRTHGTEPRTSRVRPVADLSARSDPERPISG